MKNITIFITLLTLLIVAKTKGAEIIPVWDRTVDGEVQDMDFLKGQNEILMLVGEGQNGQIQRRNPENGDLIHSFPQFMSNYTKLAITPDSLRFAHINGMDCSLRNINENYSVVSTFSLSDKQEDSIIVYLTLVTIDPIRPNAYVTTYGWNKNTNQYAPRGKVIAYNYETGEHIKDLTPYGEYEYTAIEVSHDGKYLATLNDNKAYLKVWDLETMELILNEPLFDDNNDDWCRAKDIYFSKIDPDLIYYSGLFTKKVNGDRLSGIFSYNMGSKKKRRFVKDGLYSGNKMIFLDNETRIFNSTSGVISVIDLATESLEYYGDPEKVYKNIVKYNKIKNYFVGGSNNLISKYLYDRKADVGTELEEEIVILPNPTTGIINLEIQSKLETKVVIKVMDNIGSTLSDENGILLNKGRNEKSFNLSKYSTGVYYIQIQSTEGQIVLPVLLNK